jgi:hypothetical protein
MMRIHKTAFQAIIVSALVVLAALVMTLLNLGMKFHYGAQATMDYPSLFLTIILMVAVSFMFGWLRYSLAGGLTLAIAVLHDQLLSFALCAIVSPALKLSVYTPAFLLAGTAMTYCFTIPWLRAARKLMRTNAARDYTRQMAAQQALKQVKPLFLLTLTVAVLILLAFLVSGNLIMAGTLLPLVTGLIASVLSIRLITPSVWAAFTFRSRTRR